MNVSLVLIVVMAVLFACGVYAMLEGSLTRVLIGFLLLGNATNLLLLIVMGEPGAAAFFGSADPGEMSDPLPQALTLTAIVITFAVSAFLLALIYRSWQLGTADTVTDDEADLEVRERTAEAEDTMDDETEIEHADDDATTDFVGTDTAPITILGMRDFAGLRDDAPLDRPAGARATDAATHRDTGAPGDGARGDAARGPGARGDGAADSRNPDARDPDAPDDPGPGSPAGGGDAR